MSGVEVVPLVQVDQKKIALRFVDYLNSLNIQAYIQEDDGAFVIYCQAEQASYAHTLFNEFALQPYHPKYQQAAWEHGQPNADTESASIFAYVKDKFLAHAGVVTLTVFMMCWGVFLASQLGFARDIFAAIKFYSALDIHSLFSQPQRLLGPAFFHFSWLHIVFNTMWWWQLGGAIEKVYGKTTLLNVFLLSAIASNVGQFIASGDNFGGLSGVVYAVVGFVWWSGWLQPDKGLTLPKPIIGFMLVWLVLGFIDLLPINMANTAHLLGLVSGCLAAYWLHFSAKKSL